MQIALYLDRARLFRWQLVLADELAKAGHSVAVQFRDTAEPLPTSFTVLLDLDRALGHEESERFSTRLDQVAFARFATGPSNASDLVIDLSTASRRWPDEGRTLRPLYDGSSKDFALFHALLNRRAPMLEVADTNGNAVWPIGLPGLQMPWLVAISIDETASRLIEGLLRIVGQIASGRTPHSPGIRHEEPVVADTSVLISANTFFAHKALRKFTRFNDLMMGDSPKWHVAWRMLDSADAPIRPCVLDVKDYRILPDDGRRYFADPFVHTKDGVHHVFVEEFPESTGKGVISHFTIDETGATPAPKVVLESDIHLSYPQVFAHGGEIWMLPEASASGGVDIYRAKPFPDTWVKEARLIEAPLHDATLLEHDGRLWIAASRATYQSSCWDSLVLYSAEQLLGPWQEHGGNPVLIDARSARPAGAPWREGDTLIRPAQDCSQEYGGQITLRQTTALSSSRFEEKTLGPVHFTHSSHILGPHTLARSGRLEVIDLYARPSALRAAYR
jgi:hypothetical protein